jgi:Ca-activated chloride channel homolog
MFRLAHSSFLYLLLVIPLLTALLVFFMLWRKKALQKFGEYPLIMQLMPEYSRNRLIFKFILLMIGYAFLIMALVDPQSGSKLEKVQRKGIDLMIALDVSNSMLAQDITPNRLERAKQEISKLIDQLDGDRLGIVIFAGKAYTQLPITTDYAAAKMFLSTINTNSVSVQGTAIGEAVQFSENSFGQSKANKAIIIITDGEDHEGDVIEPAEAVAKKGITIYTIGMGLPDGAPIPVFNGAIQTGFKKDREGNVIVSRLDETLLQQIAVAGKGLYIRANNSEVGLQKVLNEINKIQKSEIDNRQYSDYEDLFQYFIAFSLIFLIFELSVYDKKNQWFSRFKPFDKKLTTANHE